MDFLVINDIQEVLGRKLYELNESESAKSRYDQKMGYIFKGVHISTLILSTCHHALPESIGELTHLEDLKLIDCRELTNLPKSIGNLKNLNILDCTGCRSLEALPDDIGLLKNLEHLDLTECFSIKHLPSTLTNLKNLKNLTLNNCQSLTSLPQNLGDLRSLEVLDLENCRSLNKLPDSITNLPNLQILRLKSCNSMEYLPKDLGNLGMLKNIELVGCSRLSSIPESVSKLNLLESLNLRYCYSLTELPESIGSIQNLNSFILKGCRELEFLPSNIGSLINLKNLDLFACRMLNKLPDSIKNLKDLIKLDLSYCDKLSGIPRELKELSNLNIITSPISIEEDFPPNNLYNLQPHSYDNELSPYRIKQYQEKIDEIRKYQETVLRFSHDVSDKINYYVNHGVKLQDAKIMANFSFLLDRNLILAKIDENLDENQDDMHWMFHYKINSDGRVIELHIHHAEMIFLTLFPRILCSLDQLEVIRFPNNYIEKIPECITNLKRLKVLDVSNFEPPNPIIPESIKLFIASLEKFNEFYIC